jgi:hypothetical protein
MPYSPRYGFIEDIGEKTDNRCHICHDEAHPEHYGSPGGPLKGFTTTVDHIIPQSHGGDDHPDNLLLAHFRVCPFRETSPPTNGLTPLPRPSSILKMRGALRRERPGARSFP